MKAAVLTEVGKIEIREADMPEPGPNEVLIRVRMVGICGSDHTLFHGRFGVPLPVIPGHEGVGTIVETGKDVTTVKSGQRVTIQPNFACGHCPLCEAGHGNLCPSKIRLGVDSNGAFAEYVKVPAHYVWPIPEGLPDDVAVFTEPLSVGVHAMNITEPKKEDKVLIFGAGIIGLLTMQLAVSTGADVTACDLATQRLALAEKIGATGSIGPEDSIDEYENTFDVIYETSGAPSALNQVIRLAAPKAKIIVLSLPGKEDTVSIDSIVRKELIIRGSLIYTTEFPKALTILQQGQIQTGPLTTDRIALEGLNQILEDFSSPDRIKTLVEI